MNPENLFVSLHGPEVDQSELEQLLLAHFGFSSSTDPEEIQCLHQNESDPALILRYNKDGELIEIYPGPGLRQDDLPQIREKIREQLLTQVGERVGQVVLFAHVPTDSYFRHKELFQILPVPP